MKYFILLISLLFVLMVNAQNVPVQPGVPAATPTALPTAYIAGPVNYIRSWTANMITTDGEVVSSGSRTPAEVQETTQYFDGLGRPVQTVVKGISPVGRDLVTPVVYDSYGRIQFGYLPYTQLYGNTSDGLFKSQPFTVQQSFYQDTANYAGASIQSIFYSQQAYEASPLNRVLKTWAPGNSWSVAGGSHPVTKQYLTNTLADSVVNWQQPASGLPLFNGVYNAGELLKEVTIDENGAQVVVFTDKENHVLLRKVQVDEVPAAGHGGWLCTYYVYDIRGNLRFVMPPKAVALMGNTWNPATVAAGLCFQYHFDGRDRLVVKKLPDADSLEMVYDNRDRLAFSRDGSQKQAGVWLATFYDDINRPVMTGIYANSNSRETLQVAMNSAVGSQTFTNSVPAPDVLTVAHHDGRNQYIGRQAVVIEDGFDTGTSETEIVADAGAITTSVTSTVTNTLPGINSVDITPLSYTWYGAYDFPGAITFQAADTGKLPAGVNPYALRGVVPSTKTKGLVTGTRTKILGTADGWITSTIYYDDKGRQIQICSNNITGGVDVVSNLYDFSGKLLATYHRQTNLLSGTTPQFTTLTTMHYDHVGRLDEIKQKVNDQDSLVRTIAASTFDELGRVKSRRIGVKPAGGQMETQQFTYNLAGWQTGVNANYVNNGGSTGNWFGEVLSYDTGFTQSQYNGNIAGVLWKSGSDGVARAYGYRYDASGRLAGADFRQQNTAGASWTNDLVKYDVPSISYDANGNITTMTQWGMNGAAAQPIDILQYGYHNASNKLNYVTDNGQSLTQDFKEPVADALPDYQYDTTGSLIQDLNKGLSIIYNHLHLPVHIEVSGKGTIDYVYDALGNKLRKTVQDNTVSPSRHIVRDYLPGAVYRQDSLELISTAEGRVRTVYRTGIPVGYVYDYFLKDHLGNVRTVLTEQTDFNMYVASMEEARAPMESQLFDNVDATRSAAPVGYPASDGKYVAKLNADGSHQKTGPAITLRVMAGDTISIGVNAFFKSTGRNKSKHPLNKGIANQLLQSLRGIGVGVNGHNNPATTGNIPALQQLSGATGGTLLEQERQSFDRVAPRAHLNFAVFNDRFKLVEENTGICSVRNTPDELQSLTVDKFIVNQTGFLYVYTNNESIENVYFDNLTVTHIAGPLLEETHYYPFGGMMEGISSNALKGLNYAANRSKFNGIELNSDLDLYSYEARYRNLDPQLGRWWQIDPKPNDAVSPYAAMDNNPIRYSDFLGDTTIQGGGIWRNLWEGAKEGGRSTAAWFKSLGTAEGIGRTLDGLAAMSPFNIDEGSVSARAQMIDNSVNYVADIPNKTSDQIAHDVGFGVEKIGETVVASKGAGLIKSGIGALNSTTLYRAVSGGELASIAEKGGLSMSPGTYETGKLFATSSSDAAQFGKFNYGFDQTPNTIIKVKVPNAVMKTVTRFEADGMPAISVPANQLPKINFVKPLNFSPRPTNPFNAKGW